jgi:Lrp/AsnC family leucine-responsive transcriptional regulator
MRTYSLCVIYANIFCNNVKDIKLFAKIDLIYYVFSKYINLKDINAKDLQLVKLDDYDRKIINALQSNGRLSNIDVAGLVNLSHSSCSRRIARLEGNGVIVGYRALTDRQKLGLSVRAYCGVIRDSDVGWKELADNLAKIEGVVSVFAVSGDVDLMLEIVARDMEHYSQVVLRDVFDTKGVNATRSSFVLAEVKSLY